MTSAKIVRSLLEPRATFGTGYVRVEQEGTASVYVNTLNHPAMNDHAMLHLSTAVIDNPNSNLVSSFRVKAESLRSLAAHFINAAEQMEAGLGLVDHAPKFDGGASLLTVHENGDTYFTGDLDAGKALAEAERYPVVSRVGVHSENYGVELFDDPDHNDASEWGSGTTEEEAWRFVLGAFFGPIDDGYDEGRLRTALTNRSWSDPIQ